MPPRASLLANLACAGLLASVGLFLGCSRETTTSASEAASTIPEPVLPTPSLARTSGSKPAWVEALPAVDPVASKGDRVWAAVSVLPGAEMAEVGVFQVEAVYEGRYSLIGRLGQRRDGVKAAVVHPVGDPKGLRENDVALIYTKTTPGFLGRVAELVAGAEIRVRYDFGGTTRLAAVDHAERPREGVVPLAFVSFPKSGGRSRGLVLAMVEDRAFIRTASGHVEIHPTASIEALPPLADRWKVGAKVRAFRWATGLRAGVVTEEIEPGLRYRVRLYEQPATSDYFFTALFPG